MSMGIEAAGTGGRRARRTPPGGFAGVGRLAVRAAVRTHAGALVLMLAPVLWAGSACRASAPGPDAGEEPSAPAPERSSKADEPNTTDGIYTDVQAERGHDVFRAICTECHVVNDWTAPAFLNRWEEASVFRLWYWIYERMPHGQPGTLSRQQVTDALTYILQLNGLPPGETELASDDDTLDDYWIIWKVK